MHDSAKPFIFAFGVITAGFSLAVWGGCSDISLALNSEAEPQTITAHQLATEGPGDNCHVNVTEYLVLGKGVADEKGSWVVLKPRQRTRDGATLLVKQDRDFISARLADEDSIQGLVYDGQGDVSVDARNALRKRSNVDLEKIWIIDRHREPPGVLGILLKVGGGLGLVILGAGIFFLCLKATES